MLTSSRFRLHRTQNDWLKPNARLHSSLNPPPKSSHKSRRPIGQPQVRTRIVVSHALLDRFGNCGIVALLNPCETEIAMLVGYARTSTAGQIAGVEAQERELRAAGCDKIFREQVSSVAERQQLEAALDYVRERASVYRVLGTSTCGAGC